MKTKKVGSAGRFGPRYGKTVKERLLAVEVKQRQKQKCLFCSKLKAKRTAKGIWKCGGCGKSFAGAAYYLSA